MNDHPTTIDEPIVFARYPRGEAIPSISLVFRPDRSTLNDETQLSIAATDLDSESLAELERFIEAARPVILTREAADQPIEAIIDEPARDPIPMSNRMSRWSNEGAGFWASEHG